MVAMVDQVWYHIMSQSHDSCNISCQFGEILFEK